MKKIIFILLFPIQLAFGQPDIYLDSCYNWARTNYPSLRNTDLWKEISILNQDNYSTAYLPQVILNGRITYQSDVTSIPISVPGMSIPDPPKDRYNAYAEIQQTIWDGGLSKLNKSMEEAILKSNLSQLEIEVYQLKTQVANSFYSWLSADLQKQVLAAQEKILSTQLIKTEAAIANGASEPSTAISLQAEILKLKQQTFELEAAREASLLALSILTGREIDNEAVPNLTASVVIHSDTLLNRPEIQHLRAKAAQIETQKNLLTKTRNPNIFGFGQVGFGKPGLNMLADDFKGYYLVGVGISWKAFDWSNTAQQKQVLQLQQETLLNQEKTISQNFQLLLSRQNQQIIKLKRMIGSDQQLVELRSKITSAVTSKLENQTITASEYIREVEAETIARLQLKLHRIQLEEARERYKILSGIN